MPTSFASNSLSGRTRVGVCAFVGYASFLAPLFAIFLVSGARVSAETFSPPDVRTWEEVTGHFIAYPGRETGDGESDGRRLKELNPKRAAAFLLPFLAKDRPAGQRVKAIGALGWSSFREAVPNLSAIAEDPTEDEAIRVDALNPGLRYMKDPKAVKSATILAADKSERIRAAAYWVLSSHGTDDAVAVLEARLRANDEPLLEKLIFALYYSEHRRAGRIIFDVVSFPDLPKDELHLNAYAIAMEKYRIPQAQANMLTIAQQPGVEFSAFYALRYFASFPREDVVPALIARIEAEPVSGLYETVTQFIKSPAVAAESKKKLAAFIASGRVVEPRRTRPR